MQFPIEHHPLQPFLPNSAQLLMLGSFPPPQSKWSMDFYYPNWLNDMWRIFGIVFFDDPQYFVINQAKTFDKNKLIEFLECKGIALFDTAVSVKRLKANASDAYLEVVVPTDIRQLLSDIPHCSTIVTTGRKATETLADSFSLDVPNIGGYHEFTLDDRVIRHYRMPSSSRAYPLKIEDKSTYYKNMFGEIGLL